MNAAQLQNTTHLEPITVYTWPSGNNRQLASLGSNTPMYTCMNWVFRVSDSFQTKYTTGGEVLSSIAKTAFLLCVHGSRTVALHYGSTKCTLSLIMYTSKCPNKTAFIAFWTKSLQTTLMNFQHTLTCLYFGWICSLSNFFFIFFVASCRKQSIKTRLPPVSVGAGWGLCKVWTLTIHCPNCSSALIKYTFSRILVQSPADARLADSGLLYFKCCISQN